MKRVLKILVRVLGGATLLSMAAPLVGEAIAIYPPVFPRQADDQLRELGVPHQDVEFPSGDGITLRGWFIPAGEAGAPAVIYAPATGHDQRAGLSLAPALHEAGYHVLLFSYRGYGQSDGARGRFTYGDAESRDVDAAVRFLSVEKGITQVAVVGHSAGAASAILSAARNPSISAVVALAPFNTIDEVWQTNRPSMVPAFVLDWTLWVAEQSRSFSREYVRPIEVVDEIAPRPLLVIHGTEDQRVTQEQVQQLVSAAREPKSLWLIEGATHDGIRTEVMDRLLPDVIGFLDHALREGPGSRADLAYRHSETVKPGRQAPQDALLRL